MDKLRGNQHATSGHKAEHAPTTGNVRASREYRLEADRHSDATPPARFARVKTAVRIGLVVALAYILTVSNVLSPLGMALARAYATDTPLVTSINRDARAAEGASASTADAAGSDGASAASDDTEGASSQHENAITPPHEKNEPVASGQGDDAKGAGDASGAGEPVNGGTSDDGAAGTIDTADDNDAAESAGDGAGAGESPHSPGGSDQNPSGQDSSADAPAGDLVMPPAGSGSITKNDIYPYITVTDAEKVSDNAWLARKGSDPKLVVKFDLGSTSGYYGTADGGKYLTVTMQIPYLILESDGTITQVLDKAEWEKVPEAQRARLAVTPKLDEGWVYYDSDGNEIENGAQMGDGLTGTIAMQYLGNGDGQYGNGSENPQMSVHFIGKVPENAGADIKIGMKCTHMFNGKDTVDGNLDISADENPMEYPAMPRLGTFINSNLTWEQTLELVDVPVLWDTYNYVVYKVTVTNTSEDADSDIERFNLNLEPEPDLAAPQKHLQQKDLAVWQLDAQGTPQEVTDPSTQTTNLVGQPGKGGVLIYDVTDVSEEALKELDTDRFSNADKLLGDPMPYLIPQAGSIYTEIKAPEGSLQGGRGENSSRSYYVAFPYSTNLYALGGIQPSVLQSSIATVCFGANGMYSWSIDSPNIKATFEEPKIELTQQKRARDLNTRKLVENADGLVGWEGSYIIDGLSTKGANIPVYGPESDGKDADATGPYVLDIIPTYYDLQSLDFQVSVDKARKLSTRVVPEWFDAERGLAQIKLDDGSWRSLNATPVDLGEVSEDGASWNTYRIGTAVDGSGASVGDLIAQVERQTGKRWTREVRFLLSDGLPADKDLPVRIKVNGVLGAPTKRGFTNTIVTHYGQRHWNVKTATEDAHYTVNPRESKPDTAVYSPVIEVAPTVTATGHTELPGGQGQTEGQRVEIPLTVGNSGWKFGLGNTSQSHMQPARFETTPLPFVDVDGNMLGFRVETITLSAGLLAQSSIKQMTLHFEDGGTQTLKGSDIAALVDPAGTGNALLTRDAQWPNDLLTHITIDFDSISGGLDPAKAWVDMSGVSTRVADYQVTGTLKTMYTGDFDTPEFQKSANATATLSTVKAVMDVSTHGRYVDVTEATDPKVPANTDGNQTQISVPYDRDFQLWAQLTNSGISPLDDTDVTLAVPLEYETGIMQADGSEAEAWTGFHTTRVTLTSEFLDTWDEFGEIRLYDADDMGKPAWVLRPTKDGAAFEDERGARYERTDGGAGDLVIEEAAWFDAADDLKAVKLAGWKGMATGSTSAEQRVVLDGFEDAALGHAHDLRARTVNYFSGVRPDNADDPLLASAPAGGLSEAFAQLGMDAMTRAMRVTYSDAGEVWSASSNDATTVYVSKMAFDVSARAAYYDGAVGAAGARFTRSSTPDDEGHYRKFATSSGSYDETNKTLEIGYKAIGSYLLDLRQYTNAYNVNADRAWDQEQADIAEDGHEYGTLLSGKTYNTAAHVTLAQDLPEDGFDAYYIKIHPNALGYLERIEVRYSDGTTSVTTPDQWGGAEAVERDANGAPFVRIGLLGKDGVDVSGGDAASRDAFADYGDDDFKDGAYQKRTVDKIIYTLDINKAQYADEAHTQANNVDFGTWYTPSDATTASLEVTGRFFRDDKRDKEKTNAVTCAALAIGGAHAATQRTGARAQERFTDAKNARGVSAWSYQDTSWDSSNKKYDYKMGHIESTAKVDVSVDSHYVMKGVHDDLKIDTYQTVYGDENVAYGSDQHFSVSYYRKHVPYSSDYFHSHKSPDYYYDGGYDRRSGDDWGADRVAFADHVTFADELPLIDENAVDPAMSEFYGFLTTAVQLAGQPAGKDDAFIEHATKATFTTKKIKRGASGQLSLIDGRTIEVSGEELRNHREADGSIYINAAPDGQADAPELKTVASAYDLALERDEVLVSYEVELENLGGDADGSREIAQTHDAEASGASADIDVRVYGRPYVYAGQKESAKEDSLNTASVTSATSYAPETPLTSQDNGYYSYSGGDTKTESARDQAYFLGYLVTFDSTPDIRIAGSQHIYDYKADNNTPTTAPFEVRYKNRDDADAGAGRSARIDGVTLHVDVDDPETDDPYQGMYRLRNLYIPQQFVGAAAGGAADWFEVAQITFKTGTNKTLAFTLKDLLDQGYLSSKPNADGMYAVDVERMLREDFAATSPQGLVGTHRGLDATDTLKDASGDGWVGSAWDLTYAKPFVSDVSVRLEAVAADIAQDDSVLAGGQWLSPTKAEDGVAFSFDGIYVDRTAEDFKAATGQDDRWNETSTPTFGKQYAKQGVGLEHVCRVNTEDPSSIDPNSTEHPKRTDTAMYLVHNLVAHPDVVVERGVEVAQADGTNGRFFAYDRDDASVTEPTTQDPHAGAANNIPNGALMPGDYVEYTVQLHAAEPAQADAALGDSPVPLEYTQGRFTVPRGQRIVGWEEVANTTGQTVSAEFVEADDADGDGSPSERREAKAKQDYSLDEAGGESYELNRNLVFAVGAWDEDNPDASQIPVGTGVTLRVITQLTDELQGDAAAMQAYQDTANEPFVEDEPAFEDKRVTAEFITTTMPKHGYVQARYQTNGNVKPYEGTMADSWDHDVETPAGAGDEDYRVTHTVESTRADLDDRLQTGMATRSKTRFYEHPDGSGEQAIAIAGEFTEQAPTGGIKQNDGSPAKLTVSGIQNRTRHTQDMTVSVSFMSRVKGSKPGTTTKDYQGFELTEAPHIPYPDGIPTNNERKPVLVEYYDASADGGAGAWVTEDKLQETALPTSTEEAASAAARNSHEGPFGWLVDLFTPNEEDPIGPSEVVRASKTKFHSVQAVRWTYFDIPATAEDGLTSYSLPNVELIGVGRFADTRPATGEIELNDSFGAEHVDLGVTHRHNELGSVFDANPDAADGIVHDERIVKYDEQARCDFKVWRRTPILTFQSQVFQDDAQAAAPWDPQAPQKTGYVPGESFWYKETLWNMPAGTNSGAPNLEGELYNPAIYVKIPTKYLVNKGGGAYTLDASKVKLSWVDHEGAPVEGARVAAVEQVADAVDGVETGELPDYGGSMNYVSTVADKMTGAYTDDTTAKGYFSDMKPADAGVSNSTDFALYKITFANAASGGNVPTCMNVGDRIEVRYEVTAATDGLPQVYLDADGDLDTDTDRSPAYFPRIGEYFAGYQDGPNQVVNPLNSETGDGFGAHGSDGVFGDNAIKVNNGGVLMDMDALLHDAAFSGDKPEQSDRWEAFDAPLTYIPGSAVNKTDTAGSYQGYYLYGTSGNNGAYLDMDVKTGVFQQVRYTPRAAGTDVASRDMLPGDVWLITPNTTPGNTGQESDKRRDWDVFVTSPRTRGNTASAQQRWGHTAPLVWSQASTHMQKAWLAAASDMQPDESDYKRARAYEPSDLALSNGSVEDVAFDPHYAPWPHGGDNDNDNSVGEYAYDHKGTVLGKYAAALQYNQDFTTSLQALNYGDRTLDGVEMLYVMPRGVEPKLADGAAPQAGDTLNIGATAEVLASSAGETGTASDPKVLEAYSDASSALEVTVVQTPYSDFAGFYAPSDPQDPGYYRDGAQLKAQAEDLSRDPARSSYEAEKSNSSDRTSRAYAESSQPWVLKVTVKAPLGKWYGRNIDGDARNTADADGYAGDAGYKIRVNLPSHVFANNEAGTWNDRLLVTPWDDSAAGKPSSSSSYFSVMDVDHYEGANAKAANLNDLQVFGMDYMFTHDDVGAAWELAPSSPNMPSVNGYSVLNNSVLASADATGGAGAVADRTAVGYDRAGKSGTLWAQTGTRAVMRKPYVRAWDTVGDDGVTGAREEYYLDADYDGAQLNVHVENRYWWDDYAATRETGASYDAYEGARHGYATDGGQKGDLVLPVVTTVLPEHIVVVDEHGKPYPTDGKRHPLTNWGMSTAVAEDYQKGNNAIATSNEAAMERYDAEVSYEEVAQDNGAPAKRYVVRFIAKDPEGGWNRPQGNIGAAPDANTESRIPSGVLNTFSFQISTVAAPTYDGDHPETGRSYENVRTYVTSKMGGYQFLSDEDVPDNPYKVGAPAQAERAYRWGGNGAEGDVRLDASVATYTAGSSSLTLGVLPHDVIDDGPDTVSGRQDNRIPGYAERYRERATDGLTPGIEDYTFRTRLNLGDGAAAALDGDAVTSDEDPFARRASGLPDASADDGLLATFKLRASAPRLVADHAVEFNPDTDVPSLEDNDLAHPAGARKAGHGERIGRDGAVSSAKPDADGSVPASEPLQYGDTPWYRATLANDSGGEPAYSGAVLHGKLVFAVHLPRQVSFYDKRQLTDGNFTEGDAGRFYLEWTHTDRITGKTVTDKLTPRQLVDSGWYVHVREVPNWGANDFTQEDYAKPDTDTPNDDGTDPTAKPRDHEGETLVFEFAAPNDATDGEFAAYGTLISAMRGGVHADGYFGSGDVLTLRVKTRVDNVGAEGIEDLTTDWLADESSFYATVHDLDGADWPEGAEPGEDSWIRGFTHVGTSEVKPIYDQDSDNIFERPLAMQHIETFKLENQVSDAPAQTRVRWGWPLLAQSAEQDFDCDQDLTDVYTSAQSGAFAIAKPAATSRIDTKAHRVQVTNPDLGSGAADDAHMKGDQYILLDQAVNTGAAVNSFVVDWEIPYHGKGESSVEGPAVNDPLFNSRVQQVATGVWEIPGSSVEADASADALAKAAYEQALRVYVLVRTEPIRGSETIYDNVDYPQPGTSADRASYGDGSWRVVGSQTGYPVRRADGTKENVTIDLGDPATPGALKDKEGVKQIRWVIKAEHAADPRSGLDAVASDAGADALPVPTGFRLDVDAVPDDPNHAETIGKQEADELDPRRQNIGWEWAKDAQGTLLYDKQGDPQLVYESPMPDSFLEHGAFVRLGGSADKTFHLNHFIQTPLRYDDTKFMPSERSRAGYYRDEESPQLGIDVEQFYFTGGPKTGYEWKEGVPSINVGMSKMMKYRVTLHNFSTEELEAIGKPELSGDTCTNPDISVMVPLISALIPDDEHFAYVPYEQVKDNAGHVLNDGFRKDKTQNPDGTTKPATNIDKETPRWTYYAQGEGVEQDSELPVLESTSVGTDSVRAKEQLSDDLEHNRQYLSLHFTGPDDGTGESRGILKQGQELVFEFMMPIRDDAATVTSNNLLNTTGYVHKEGSFAPYLPDNSDSHETTSFVLDTRDANLDGSTSHVVLAKNLTGLSFASVENSRDSKTATTQVDTLFTKDVHGAAAAPEGTDYTYSVRVTNLSSNENTAHNYIRQVVYDVLPYEGDTEIKNLDNSTGERVPRLSQWNGWLTDLGEDAAAGAGAQTGTSPAIRVYLNAPGDNGSEALIDPKDYELWVGPFTKDGAGIEPAGVDELPNISLLDDNDLPQWVQDHRANKGDVMHADHFVTLKELQEHVLAHPEREEELRKNVRAIWCQVTNDDLHLPAQGSLELRYDLHAPLNLPKFLGDTTKKAPSAADKESPLYQRLAEAAQWNSFFEYFSQDGTNEVQVHTGELSQAGVMVDAPENRGYLGDYVWLDADWSQKVDDTASGAAAYEESKNGRALLRGVRPNGTAFDNSASLRDLDGDGAPDDPGINGVRVELLNKHGLPVNRNGEAVKWLDGIGVHQQGLWVVCDPQTGEPIKDASGSYVVAEAGGPLSYTTESDYYGNPGYYMLSNLATSDDSGKALTYRLRFTFPERYAGYAVTTTTTGDGVDVACAREQDANGVERLVATTGEIKPTPVAYDKDKFANGEDDPTHDAYDAKAVSHDIGIALPVRYGGTAWRDDLLADGLTAAEPVDGRLDKQDAAIEQEARVAGATVSVHEFDPATQEAGAVALDAYGNPATMTTGDDGRFGFTLKPGKRYVVMATVNKPLKPTPLLHEIDPTIEADDNDLYTLHGKARTHEFTATAPVTAAGAPDYVTPGNPSSGYKSQDVLGLGYVDDGMGFIGNTVWNDLDQNGLQDAGEPGIEGLEVTLETYWWNADADDGKGGKGAWEWLGAGSNQTTATNAAGAYAFRVPTYLTHPDDAAKPEAERRAVLAGYRVRIDRAALEALGYPCVVTRWNNGDDELDSDLKREPETAADGTLAHVMHQRDVGGRIVVAAPADDATDESVKLDGPLGAGAYDVSAGLAREDVDAGLALVATSAIEGVVWEDADRDGLQDTAGDAAAEQGMAGQQVRLEQWYLDGKTWKRNEQFGDAATPGELVAVTGATGTYRFEDLPTAHADAQGELHLAAYRLRLDALAPQHLLTRYHASIPGSPEQDTSAIDSDARGVDLRISDRDAFVAGKPLQGTRPNKGQVILAAKDADGSALVGATDPATGAYNMLMADATLTDDAGAPYKRGGDVGQAKAEDTAISGMLWQDLDDDGVRDAQDVWVDDDGDAQVDAGEMRAEAGVAGVAVRLVRYVADPAADEGWTLDASFEGGAGYREVTTAADGSYAFDGLEVARDGADGSMAAYGYRVMLTDAPGVKDTWHIGRYRQGGDRTVDSDLLPSGELVDVSSGEVLVLMDKADDSTPDANRIEAPAALPTDGSTVAYDVLAPREVAHRDGALLVRPEQDIAGCLWADADHDGVREPGEAPLAGKAVKLQSWILRDGAWEPYGVDRLALTDNDGHYLFGGLPVSVREQGVELLCGYTLTVKGGTGPDSVGGLPVTAVQVDSPALDGANSKVHRPAATGEDFAIAWDEKDAAEDGRRTMDGKLVLAGVEHADSYAEYHIGGFDVSAGASELRMHGGFGPFGTGSLAGVVWDDASYDGLQDLDEAGAEHGVAGVAVHVTQWYQADDGAFVQNEGFGSGADHAVEATTDAEGRYVLDGLPVYVQLRDGAPVAPGERGDDDFRLAAYRVSLPEMPGGYAATRFHVGDDPTADSDLKRTDTGDLDIVETHGDGAAATEPVRGDGFAILAEPAAKGDRVEYEAVYNGVRYDAVRTRGQQRGGDAGLVAIGDTAAIEGVIFEDADADGVRADGETGAAGVRVALTRYMRPAVGAAGGDAVAGGGDAGTAVKSGEASGNGAAAGATWLADAEFSCEPVVTGKDGRYRFAGLPTSGYRTVEGMRVPVLYGYRVNVTEMPRGFAVTRADAGDDAARDSDLDAATTRLVPDAPVSGLTVLAERWESDEDTAVRLTVDGLGSFTMARSHDESGLDAGLVPQGTTRIAGFVWEDTDRDGWQDAGEYLRVLQPLALDRRVLDDVELEQAGFGGTMTDGAPGSGLDDTGEPLVPATPGEPVLPEGGDTGSNRDLPRLETDGVWSPGTWTEVATGATGLDGRYAFEDLPVADEAGRPYVYRVRMAKPEGSEYVPVNAGADDAHDNDYGHLNAPGVVTPQEVGVTDALPALQLRADGVDAWGQPWDVSAPKRYDREAGASVDLAVFVPADVPAGQSAGLLSGLLPQTGDPGRFERLLALAAGAVGMLCIAVVIRRRKREE